MQYIILCYAKVNNKLFPLLHIFIQFADTQTAYLQTVHGTSITQSLQNSRFSTIDNSNFRHDAKTIDKVENLLQLKDWQIGEPLNNKLNKLKKSNPEAFFYWYKIYELKGIKDK